MYCFIHILMHTQLCFVAFRYYSHLKASTGLSLEACIAGINPDKVPIKNANNKHPVVSHQGNAGLNNDNPAEAAMNPPNLAIK